MTHWQRRDYLVPAAVEDEVTATLWEGGILGCEVRDAGPGSDGGPRVRIVAWFPSPLPPSASAFDVTAWSGGEVAGEETVEERDWLAAYRATARPIDAGIFHVDPRDLDEPAPEVEAGRTLLRIPAQSAFGTGSHETTRLVLGWLGDLDLAGSTTLDVGTGSGILALAALARGARSAIGFDIDPTAPPIARRNATVNRLAPSFFAGTLAALGERARFDLIVVNVLPERIAPDLPRLPGLLTPGGRVLSSGNLVERRDELLARFAELGLSLVEERVDGEWVAFLLRRG